MVEPLRHRQTKGAETDMPGLPPPRHFPTLPVYREDVEDFMPGFTPMNASHCAGARLVSSFRSASLRSGVATIAM